MIRGATDGPVLLSRRNAPARMGTETSNACQIILYLHEEISAVLVGRVFGRQSGTKRVYGPAVNDYVYGLAFRTLVPRALVLVCGLSSRWLFGSPVPWSRLYRPGDGNYTNDLEVCLL